MGMDAQGSLVINRGMRMQKPVSGSAMSDAMGSSRMSGGRMASGSSDGNTKVWRVDMPSLVDLFIFSYEPAVMRGMPEDLLHFFHGAC